MDSWNLRICVEFSLQVLFKKQISKFSVCIFLLLVTLCTVVNAESWQSNDYIVESFHKITMQDVSLKKWQTSIYYQVEHHVDDVSLHENLVVIQLKQLQDITGLIIRPADLAHKANMTIVLTTENQLKADIKHHFKLTDLSKVESLARNKIGITSLLANQQGYIEQSIVIIATDRARAYGRLLTSLSEMLSRALGMQYHSTDVYPSIFNGRSVDIFLTGLDYMMLKLLYDQRIKPGADVIKMKLLVASILNEKGYQYDIAEAALAVRKSGLSRLIN